MGYAFKVVTPFLAHVRFDCKFIEYSCDFDADAVFLPLAALALVVVVFATQLPNVKSRSSTSIKTR